MAADLIDTSALAAEAETPAEESAA